MESHGYQQISKRCLGHAAVDRAAEVPNPLQSYGAIPLRFAQHLLYTCGHQVVSGCCFSCRSRLISCDVDCSRVEDLVQVSVVLGTAVL